jgi:hypothetical protein
MVDTQSSERAKELSFARLHHHALKLEGPVKRADNFTSRRKSNRKRSSLHEIVRASTTFLVHLACAKIGLPHSVRKNTFATWKTSKRGTRSVAKKCSWWHICAVRLRILDLISVPDFCRANVWCFPFNVAPCVYLDPQCSAEQQLIDFVRENIVDNGI